MQVCRRHLVDTVIPSQPVVADSIVSSILVRNGYWSGCSRAKERIAGDIVRMNFVQSSQSVRMSSVRILRSQQRNIFALVEPIGGLEGVTDQFGHRENARPGCRIFRHLHTFVEVLAKLWVIDETGDDVIPQLVTLRQGPSTSQLVGDQELFN